MKIYKVLTILHHMPLDWNVLWGDSSNLLHPALDVYYNKDLHKTFVIVLSMPVFGNSKSMLVSKSPPQLR